MSTPHPWARGVRVRSTFPDTEGKEAWIRGVNYQNQDTGRYVYYISFLEPADRCGSGTWVSNDDSGTPIFSYSEGYLVLAADVKMNEKYGIVSTHPNRSHPPRHN